MEGQDSYTNNTSYIIKTKKPTTNRKPCRLQLKINKTQKLGDLINTALSEVQYIKTRKAELLKPLTSVSMYLRF